MNAITVNKNELLAILHENRKKHRDIFLEAQAGYRTAVIAELDSMLADARNGKKIRRSLTLIEPMDQTKDYDKAIKMMEMSIEDDIKLEEHDFQCFVLDQWTWKKQFSMANFSYSDTLKNSPEE
jgi:hypothetical protein